MSGFLLLPTFPAPASAPPYPYHVRPQTLYVLPASLTLSEIAACNQGNKKKSAYRPLTRR